ncbi:MAG TPA: UDP-N-acetylglucosamine 2-epimerase (hydrolyzing) [Desulfotomaculum sp.]|nr:UDP-N-acetylglucosamine 2-epimerase (hydrolyzing) [Desulfotomaculum sp.]
MRKVLVFTTTRAEFGLLKPTLRRIVESDRLKLVLVAAGEHVAPEKGRTLEEITEAGLPLAEVVNNFALEDEPKALTCFVGELVVEFADLLARWSPDLMLLLGDRYELLAPATAAVITRIPIAHISGGESTEGLIDEQVRHAVSKMAHLHFVSTVEYGYNLRRMGEEAWRIHVVGAPGIENIFRGELMEPEELFQVFGIDVNRKTLLVTYHPETLMPDGNTAAQVRALTAALREFPDYQQVITYPGMEVGFGEILRVWEEYVAANANARLFPSLGSRGYLGVMKYAAAVVGNSSSGIIEAPSLRVPTVNIGDRQKGRLRAASVIDVPCRKEKIAAGLRKALCDEEFRSRLKGLRNPYDPYGDGNVSGRVVSVLEAVPLDRRLLEKRLDFAE